MTRSLALAIWATLAFLLAGCEVLSLLTGRRFAGLLELTRRVTRPLAGRVVLLAGWMWLGWHLFAR